MAGSIPKGGSMPIYSWFEAIQLVFLVILLFAGILCFRARKSRSTESARPTSFAHMRVDVRRALALLACGFAGLATANLLSSPLTERSPVTVVLIFSFLLLNLFFLFKYASS